MSAATIRIALLSTGILIGAAMPVAAQEAAPGPAAAEEGKEAFGDIVVTAQWRSETLSKVPISIAASSQEDLDALGVKNINDISRVTPGLTSLAAGGGALDDNISIRGIVSNVGAATTGVYVDETAVAARFACFYCGFTSYPKVFDLERVEVLRGPQGTLFGAGSMGGTIRFITPKPGLDAYSGYARAEIATTRFGGPSWEVGGAVGGPIVKDKLGFRGSLWTRTDGGYVDLVNRQTGAVTRENANKEQAVVARVAVTAQPVEGLTITPSVFYQRTEADNRSLYWPQAGRFRSFAAQLAPKQDRQAIYALDVSYELGGVELKSVTSYFDRKQSRKDDYTGIEFIYYAGVPENFSPLLPGYVSTSNIGTTQKNWTQEFRLSTISDGPLSATAGLYFANSKTAYQQDIVSDLERLTQTFYGLSVEDFFGAPMLPGNTNYIETQAQRDREYAGFANVTYAFTDALKLSAGARVSHIKSVLDVYRDGPVSGGLFSVTRKTSATPVTPRATLSYQAGDTMLYASAAKGFRIGGGNTSVTNIPSCGADLALLGGQDVPGAYDPDSLWSYEVGVKTRIPGGRLTASAFRVDWSNIQTNIILPTCGFNYTANVGKAVSQGFDLDISLRPVEGLTLQGSVGYIDAKNKTDVTAANGTTFLIHSGSKLALPDWTVALGAQYEFPVSATTDAYLRADYQYSAAYTLGFQPGDVSYDADTNNIDASNYVSARAGIRVSDVDVSVFVNNLFDERPVLNRYHELPGQMEFREATLRPRTFGATVTYRF